MSEYFFISDIHVGAVFDKNKKIRYQKLISFFNSIKKQGNQLFIIGDLFDFWFEYKHAVPSHFYSILFEISKLIEAGVTVHFLPGNHDCWNKDFLVREVGMKIHPEVYAPTIFGKKFYLFHGDGILKKDKGYRLLKKIIRHPFNIALYRWVHPDIGIPLAKLTSQGSREYTNNRFSDHRDEYFQFAQHKFSQGFDIVIIGHTHRPLIQFFGEKAFLNLGDWISSFTYARFTKENGIQLESWNS